MGSAVRERALSPLTYRQQLFCTELLVDFNATAAAVRAGYSPHTAPQQGSRLLRHAHIQEEIQRQIDARSARVEVTQDDVLRFWRAVLDTDVSDLIRWDESGLEVKPSHEMSQEALAAIAEIGEVTVAGDRAVRVKLHDKAKVSELVARHLGMFQTSRELPPPADDCFPLWVRDLTDEQLQQIVDADHDLLDE